MNNRTVHAHRASYTRSNSRSIIDHETFAQVRAEKFAAKKAELLEKFTPQSMELSANAVFQETAAPVRHAFAVPVRVEKKVFSYEEASTLSFEEKHSIMSRAFEMSMSNHKKSRIKVRYAASLVFVSLLLVITTSIGLNNVRLNHELRVATTQN